MTHEVFCLTENKIAFTGGLLECQNFIKRYGFANKWLRTSGRYRYDYPVPQPQQRDAVTARFDALINGGKI